ncbi:preprotein translocase subunit SecD [Haloarcula amylovorans]|uniref:preprotein translocase subunit SecD n=1 Tax=Haloarcula amylovorans TaxID=2562280 RepID=UPI001075EEF2|nr:preprotein translocase subunit SecD [Halomicroarcula amylolytica]
MSAIRENWRIGALILLLLVSAVALFVPGVPPGSNPSANDSSAAGSEGMTNLQYGIELNGGTRIRAPVVGITAEGIDVPTNTTQRAQLEQTLANSLGVDRIDIQAVPRAEGGTVEVFSKNVSQSDLQTALEDAGYQPETVRQGVTEQTRDEMVEAIDQKISTSALSGGTVTQARTGERNYIAITAPDKDYEELRSILEDRGIVRMYAYYPAENGTYVRKPVLDQGAEAIRGTGTINQQQTSAGGESYTFSVTMEEGAAQSFAQEMAAAGFGNGGFCSPQQAQARGQPVECLQVTYEDEIVFNGSVKPGLGSSFADGSFAENPTLTIEVPSREKAQQVKLSLDAGQLPAPLNFDPQVTQTRSLEPALADQFKTNSLLTGLLAVAAVSLVVYGRYGRAEVALPMIVTALSEVFILLGFVAFVQYPLNLSHLAGFIAVIGTGVDDLIIIADEILQQGEVETGRVFQNRFRKAFWVIGAAAATTIVAMSPLMVLSLGDLSGFAIITIVGVLIGVLVTRPAYGDILRNLVLDES